MRSNILVIGGTGKTGRRVVEKLNRLDQKVRVGSRNENPSFDWNDRSTWLAAMAGIEKAYITYYPDLAVPGAREAIEALVSTARKAGLQKLVLLSGKGEKEAEACEQIIINSLMDYTIVRASWFMQNFSESFFLDPILSGEVALPKPEVRVPYIHADDIAEVVAQSILNEAHNGQIYQLTGPEALTFPEVMEKIGNATGRKISFIPISLEAYEALLRQHGLPESYIWLINYLFSNVLDAPQNNQVTEDIEKVLGRKPISFDQYVRETAAKGVWKERVPQSV